jgi:hypothetical protein
MFKFIILPYLLVDYLNYILTDLLANSIFYPFLSLFFTHLMVPQIIIFILLIQKPLK